MIEPSKKRALEALQQLGEIIVSLSRVELVLPSTRLLLLCFSVEHKLTLTLLCSFVSFMAGHVSI